MKKMAEKIEEKPAENREEKPKESSTLESIINETSQAGKASLNTLLGAASIASATFPPFGFGLDGLLTSASFPIGGMIENRLKEGEKKPFTSKNFRDEAIAGSLFTIPLWYGVNALRSIPKAIGLEGLASSLAVGGLTFASIPLLNAIYYPIKYLADNKKFKGMWTDLKKHYWEGTKRGLYLGIPWAATVAASVAYPALYPFLFPILAGFEVAYRVILSKEKLNYAKLFNPFTYAPNFLNPFYVASGTASAAGKIYRRVTTAASDLGAAIRNVFSKQAPAEQQA